MTGKPFPWFRIHLITAIILMFVGGIFVGGWVTLMQYMGQTPKSQLWAWLNWCLETRIGAVALISGFCSAPICVFLLTSIICEHFIFRGRERGRA